VAAPAVAHYGTRPERANAAGGRVGIPLDLGGPVPLHNGVPLMKNPKRLLGAAGLLLLAGCGPGAGIAQGDAGSIIVAAEPALWRELGDSVLRALEPRRFTVRDERMFDVTHVAPTAAAWPRLREMRQVLVIGRAGDDWVEPVLRRARVEGDVVHAQDVWARNQLATALLLDDGEEPDTFARIRSLAGALDSAFRARAVQRMYTSGADTVRRDSMRTLGYSLLLPAVYETIRWHDGVALFQNSTQLGGDLVRSVLVTARDDMTAPTAEALLAWRDSIGRTQYRPPQQTQHDRVDTMSVADGVQLQGVWHGTDPSWPTAGVFITRMLSCPAQRRTYLVDGWLFAPSRRRYEYLVQLETILSTFECTS